MEYFYREKLSAAMAAAWWNLVADAVRRDDALEILFLIRNYSACGTCDRRNCCSACTVNVERVKFHKGIAMEALAAIKAKERGTYKNWIIHAHSMNDSLGTCGCMMCIMLHVAGIVTLPGLE
jgi:hypothetical protein